MTSHSGAIAIRVVIRTLAFGNVRRFEPGDGFEPSRVGRATLCATRGKPGKTMPLGVVVPAGKALLATSCGGAIGDGFTCCTASETLSVGGLGGNGRIGSRFNAGAATTGGSNPNSVGRESTSNSRFGNATFDRVAGGCVLGTGLDSVWVDFTNFAGASALSGAFAGRCVTRDPSITIELCHGWPSHPAESQPNVSQLCVCL